MALWLAVGAALGDWAFASSTSHTDPVDDVPLLGLVAETASLIWTRWTRRPVQFGQLAILPDADTEQVAHHIALLLLVKLLHIPICTHIDWLG